MSKAEWKYCTEEPVIFRPMECMSVWMGGWGEREMTIFCTAGLLHFSILIGFIYYNVSRRWLMTHYSIYIIQYTCITTNNSDNSLMTAMCCKLLATSLFSVHALAPSSFHSWKGILYFISLKVQVARIYLNSCL